MEQRDNRQRRTFCQAYLRTMDAQRAAAEAGYQDGYERLAAEPVGERLDRMREKAAGQIRREDAVRRLAQLAFGRADDALRLALRPAETELAELDLSAVAEFKVTDKGGLEVKLVDRVRALEALCGLLEESGGGTEALYRALTEAGEEDWEHD